MRYAGFWPRLGALLVDAIVIGIPLVSIFFWAAGWGSKTVHQGILYWHNSQDTRDLLSIWQLLFVLIVALWVDADSKGYPQIYRPHEYGYLVLLYWIPYLPYYLWRTRGPTMGLLML